MREKKQEGQADNEKRKYEKPVFEKAKGMEFTEEIWKEFADKAWCFGCTNCNCN